MYSTTYPAPQKNTLVVLSGGLDSATVLALARQNTMENLYALTFDYGQKHIRELQGVKALTEFYDATLLVRSISALEQLPGLRVGDTPTGQPKFKGLLPDSWKPGRNMVFLSVAFAYAYTLGCGIIAAGVHQEDYPGYPDCRMEFLLYMEMAAIQALASPVALWVPFLEATKAKIVSVGKLLGVPYEHTWSCYRGGEKPCGECDACQRRSQAFQANGLVDPLLEGEQK